MITWDMTSKERNIDTPIIHYVEGEFLDSTKQVVGTASYLWINVPAVKGNKQALFYQLDAESQSLYEIYEEIFSDDAPFSQENAAFTKNLMTQPLIIFCNIKAGKNSLSNEVRLEILSALLSSRMFKNAKVLIYPDRERTLGFGSLLQQARFIPLAATTQAWGIPKVTKKHEKPLTTKELEKIGIHKWRASRIAQVQEPKSQRDWDTSRDTLSVEDLQKVCSELKQELEKPPRLTKNNYDKIKEYHSSIALYSMLMCVLTMAPSKQESYFEAFHFVDTGEQQTFFFDSRGDEYVRRAYIHPSVGKQMSFYRAHMRRLLTVISTENSSFGIQLKASEQFYDYDGNSYSPEFFIMADGMPTALCLDRFVSEISQRLDREVSLEDFLNFTKSFLTKAGMDQSWVDIMLIPPGTDPKPWEMFSMLFPMDLAMHGHEPISAMLDTLGLEPIKGINQRKKKEGASPLF